MSPVSSVNYLPGRKKKGDERGTLLRRYPNLISPYSVASRAAPRDMPTSASPSSLVIFSTMLRRQTGSLYTEPHRKRNLVQAFEAAGFRNHESSDNSEEHLRSRERPPVNVFCEVRIHKSESVIQQAGPCNWRNDAAEQDWSSRPNGKQRAVKDADEESG